MVIYYIEEDGTKNKIASVTRIATDRYFPIDNLYYETIYTPHGEGKFINLKNVAGIEIYERPVERYEKWFIKRHK